MNLIKQSDKCHFYASSVAIWATTTDKRDLKGLLDMMDKDGFMYSLYFVPCAWDTQYPIKQYTPVVDGAHWVATYEPKKKGETRCI